MGIHCLHCGREVAEGKAKLVFSAVLCAECGDIATLLSKRIEQGLVALKQILPPVIQRAILNKDLGYKTLADVENANLIDLLKLLTNWMERTQCQSPTLTEETSSRTSRPPALTASESSSSPSSTETVSK